MGQTETVPHDAKYILMPKWEKRHCHHKSQCKFAVFISPTVMDPDGDYIRCRWATDEKGAAKLQKSIQIIEVKL